MSTRSGSSATESCHTPILERRILLGGICAAALFAAGGCEARDEPVAVPDADDYSAILQAVLDDSRLEKHLHLQDGREERLPIVVTGDVVRPLFTVFKGGTRVVFRPLSDVGTKAFILIEKFEVRGEHADVRFQYPIEGLVSTFQLSRDSIGWRVDVAELALQ